MFIPPVIASESEAIPSASETAASLPLLAVTIIDRATHSERSKNVSLPLDTSVSICFTVLQQWYTAFHTLLEEG